MKITREQIEENLREIISRRKTSIIDKVPEGWITSEEAARIVGMSRTRMSVYLHGAIKSNEIQKKMFRVAVGTGRVIPMAHYFLGKPLSGKSI